MLGPKILGHATDIIVDGLRPAPGIDFDELHRVLLAVVGLYVVGGVLAYLQAYILAGVVQRTMYRLRADVEDKLNRLPLSYVDSQRPRRPAEPGHQRHRQHRPEPAADAQPAAHLGAHARRRADR